MARFVCRILLLLVAASSTLSIPSAWCSEPRSPRVEVLTLDGALSQAMENNRPVKNATLEVGKAQDELSAARTHLLPVLSSEVLESYNLTPESYTFEQGIFGTYPFIGPIPATDTTVTAKSGAVTLFNLSATQPISQLYRIALRLREREVALDLSREQLRSQRQTVTNDVKKAYYGILQTQSALQAAEESIKHYRELDRLTDRYLQEIRILKSESMEVKTQLAKAEYQAIALQNTLATQREQLNDLLGRDLRAKFNVAPVSDVTMSEEDLDAAQVRAIEQRPEVREAKLKVQQATYDKKIKKSEYIPDLSLNFSYLSAVDVQFLPTDVTTVGLFLRWEFFDWGRKRSELAQKTKAVEQADNSVREAESKVVIDVNNQYRKMQEDCALLRANKMGRDTSEEKLRVLVQKYGQDATLLPEVLRAEASLAEADYQYQQALLSYWTARANFEKALGEDK